MEYLHIFFISKIIKNDVVLKQKTVNGIENYWAFFTQEA